MVENQSVARLILVGLVAIIVCIALAIALQPVSEEAQTTGAKLAKVWMLDSVQRYRQIWLTHGEPEHITMDGFDLKMTQGGLVSPFNSHGQLDCGYWLAVHYPQRNIMGSALIDVDGTMQAKHRICHYIYKNGQEIVVNMTAEQTEIIVKFSTK